LVDKPEYWLILLERVFENKLKRMLGGVSANVLWKIPEKPAPSNRFYMKRLGYDSIR
jgi:hypothetical protein